MFDVDGTLAETEEAHRTAFNRSFAEAGLDWDWSEEAYRALLTTTGGRERIARHVAEQGRAPDAAQVASLHMRKNAIYAELVSGGAVVPRAGILGLIDEARRRGVTLAIATTTSRANLDALLRHVFGAEAAGWFAAIVTGEDVAAKKPDPEAYSQVLVALRLDAGACVAIEDSANGVAAARAAGLVTVATPSRYSSDDRFDQADLIRADLADTDIEMLDALLVDHARCAGNTPRR